MNTLSLKSYAKINLFLDVLNKRPDGYHNIQTVFHEIDLADQIILEEKNSGITLQSKGLEVPGGKNNLAVKAAILLKKTCKIKKGANIHLEKNIPLGAGLGGGSSNAAATLKGLSLLWNLNLNNEQLLPLAGKIGSDVPFFILGGTCFAEGRGEILTPIKNFLHFWVIIIKPGVNISTEWAYKKLELTRKKNIDRILSSVYTRQNIDFTLLEKNLYNKLESSVLPCFPEIEESKKKIESFGLKALMTGSGSAVFGITPEKEKAILIYNELKNRGENVFLSKTRHPGIEKGR